MPIMWASSTVVSLTKRACIVTWFVIVVVGYSACAALASNASAEVMAYEDVTGEFSVEQLWELRDDVFIPRVGTYVGYTTHDWWLRVDLVNTEATFNKRFIVLPIVSTAPVYAYDWVDNQLRERVASINLSETFGVDPSHLLAFDYLLAPGEQRSVLIRQTPSTNPMRLDFSVQTETEFQHNLTIATAKVLIPITILSVLLLFNLFYWVSSRDSAFGFYSGYLVSAVLISVARFGGAVYTDLPANVEASFLVIGGGLGYVFFALMLRAVLQDMRARLVDWMCFGVIMPLGLGMPVLSLYDPVVAMQLYSQGGAGALIILGLSIIVASALAQRHRLSMYLAVGYSALLGASVLAIFQFRGVLGPEFNGVLLCGIIIESFIFTFALAARFQLDLQARQSLIEGRARLQRTAQLALLGEMAASISHELKQPLNAITLVAQNLKQLAAKDPIAVIDRLPAKVDRILSLVERASELSSHVRQSSRLSTDEREVADIAKSVAGCQLMINPQLTMDNIEFLCDIPEEVPQVMIHPLRLDQVLLNLIGNAKDVLTSTNPASKWIMVSARQLNGRQLEICVADSGGGIPEHFVGRVFDQFFTTKNSEEGTGLGLFICKTIVEDAGGWISVTNTVDGARFCITLPVAKIVKV